MRRAEPCEGGDEVDAAGRFDRPGERLGLGRRGDDPEPVAQPLDGRARDEDRALERRHAGLGGGGAQDAVRRRAAVLALVCEDEVAGAVGGLGLARPGSRPGRRARPAGRPPCRPAARALRRSRPRRRRRSTARSAAAPRRGRRRASSSSGSHSTGSSRASSVRDALVWSVTCAAPPVRFQASQLSTVPKRHVALDPGEQPLELGRREVRVGHEAGALADELGRELAAALGGAPVLPDDRRVERAPVRDPRRPSSRAGS